MSEDQWFNIGESGNVGRRDWPDGLTPTRKLPTAAPSPGQKAGMEASVETLFQERDLQVASADEGKGRGVFNSDSEAA